jgi:Ca-activated chloride channel family protein
MKQLSLFMLISLALFSFSCESDNDEGLSLDNGYGLDSYNDNGVPGTPAAGEQYNEIIENPFILTEEEAISTFSIDADGGSYANTRRFLNSNQLPPADAIRTEELVNYFDYDYPSMVNGHPIALNGEISSCPWAEGHRLIRIGIRGQEIPAAELPASNIVLLIDVSGSMKSADKLELLKAALNLFVDEMDAQDRIAIVTYAGNAGLVLESTPGDEKTTIKNAINSLGAGGSTAGAEGIITAYEIAQANFVEGGNNRIIVGTDGDFNVGPASQEEIVALIESKRDLGIFLTVVGFGTGNYNDALLEQLANNGNGTYEYIDQLEQAKKVFIYEYGKFYTVAKDVKVQVQFNPNLVHSYRLIGYENRLLDTEDFEDDEKDAFRQEFLYVWSKLVKLIIKELCLPSAR